MDILAKHCVNVAVSGLIGLLRLLDTWMTPHARYGDVMFLFFYMEYIDTIGIHYIGIG